MLPFLKHKPVAGLIIAKRKADGGKEEMHQEGDESHELESHMDALIRAIHAKDSKAAAEAFKAAQSCVEGDESDEDAPEPHSYDAQRDDED